MNCIDLSHELVTGMPVYPGTASPEFESHKVLEKDGYREMSLKFFSHVGTHMDAPAHLLPEGWTLDRFPVGYFAGKGCKVDVREVGGVIGLDVLTEYSEQIEESDFVILQSGWSARWGTEDYFGRFPVLSPEAANWLVERDLKGIGLDMISVDPIDSGSFPIHHILLGQNVVIIENLMNLEALPEAGFELFCFPLKLKEADGAPVRAIGAI